MRGEDAGGEEMILDDLKNFRASPEVQRLAVALFATAAVMLFAVASTSLPNPDQRDAAPQAHESPASPPVTVSHEPAAAAPLGKCQHLVRGQWLYWAIEHRGDRMEYHHCEYMDWRGKL